jgi:hypothetical protein
MTIHFVEALQEVFYLLKHWRILHHGVAALSWILA